MQPMTLSVVYQDKPIRMVGAADSPEWVAADVCAVLGIARPHAVLRRFDEDEKGMRLVGAPPHAQHMLTVTEAGLYRLVLKSRKAEAVAFRRWVCHEVLPTIRRYGRYPANRPPVVPMTYTEIGLFGPVTMTMQLTRGQMPTLASDICPRADLIPLKAVPGIEWLPVPVSASTVYRWHQYGLRGNHLNTARISGKLFTTEAAVLEFCTDCAKPNRP